MIKNNINVVDLFAGCGGLSNGFEKVGFNILLGIDNDVDASKTFLHNHKNSKYLLKDIRKVTQKDIKEKIGNKRVDVVIGGPPCQGFSISGKRAFIDPRNSLYLEYFRIVDILKPKVSIIENVPGLSSLYDGKALDSIKNEFRKRGYTVVHKILKADEYGVPQIRKRIVIVGTKGEEFQYPKSNNTVVTLAEAISDLPKLNSDEVVEKYNTKPTNKYQKLMREKSIILNNHVGTNHSEKTKKIISMVPEGGNYKNLPKHLQGTRKVNIAWTRLNGSKPSLTIDTGHRHHFHPWENRVPSVRESARIQSFSDDFIFLGSKTSQYRQVGNAVPPLLAKSIASQLNGWFNG